MPQSPIAVNTFAGQKRSLNISAATVIKASAGVILGITVVVAGTDAPGSVNDVATNAPTAANKVFAIPNEVGSYQVGWQCNNGILVVPGTNQVLAVSFR